MLLLALASMQMGAVPNSEPALIDGVGRTTFADLGWDKDMTVSASTPASVFFRLPEDVRQGDPLWYGVHLKFKWKGNPGQVGDYAFLYGRWNGKAVYQFKTKRVSDLDRGFRWAMADLVNGSSSGYEVGDTVSIASTNMAQTKAVSEGQNVLAFSVALGDASNKEASVLISKESEVVVTGWQPTNFEGAVEAQVEEGVVDIAVTGENTGWGAGTFTIKSVIWSGTSSVEREWALGPLPPLGKVDFHGQSVIEERKKPHRVDVVLDWGSGRQGYVAWDSTRKKSIPLLGNNIFRSVVGVGIAVAILWVLLPVLVRLIRQKRRTQ